MSSETERAACRKLGALAGVLSMTSATCFRLGPRWANWREDDTEIIQGVARDVVEAPARARAILAHEIGHAEFSVADPELLRRFGRDSAMHARALNALEDTRIEPAMAWLYPGTAGWLEALRGAEVREPFVATACRVDDFLRASIYEAVVGFSAEIAAELDPLLFEALERTRSARRRFSSTLPFLPSPQGRVDFLSSEGSERTRRVVEAARRSQRIYVEEVAQELERLARRDIETIAAAMSWHPWLSAAEPWLGSAAPMYRSDGARMALEDRPDDGEGPSARSVTRAITPSRRRLARLCYQDMWREFYRQPQRRRGSRPATPGRTVSRDRSHDARRSSLRRRVRRSESEVAAPASRRSGGEDAALRARSVGANRLVRALESELPPNRAARRRGGHPSGTGVRLDAVMRFLADPARHDALWTRLAAPKRRDLAVGLLVDCSGSMRGSCIEAAIHAGEILLRAFGTGWPGSLSVPIMVAGFQTALIPVCELGDRVSAATLEALRSLALEVEGDRPGGLNRPAHNDDGPCLEAMADQLFAWPSTERLLVVISDGEPAGERSGPEELRRVVARLERRPGLTLIGLGIGEGTEHVADFYRHSEASIPVHAFPQRAAAVIRTALWHRRPARRL